MFKKSVTEVPEYKKRIQNRIRKAGIAADKERLHESVVVQDNRFVLIDKQKGVMMPLSVLKLFPNDQNFNLRMLNLFRDELAKRATPEKKTTDTSKELADRMGMKHEHIAKLRLNLGNIDELGIKITDKHVFYDPITGEHRVLANGKLVKGNLPADERLKNKRRDYHQILMQQGRDEGATDPFITAPLGFSHAYAQALLGKKGK